MKTPTNGAVIKQSGDFQSQGFSIEVSAHAFRILSSGLYSNKIRAILRELSCNAWDAHVDAGHEDQSFDIQLPSSLSPKFSIRDYGTGLSLEDLMGMYTSYFSSTKTGTNEQTGCFGLGSKSPFSYTDKFTVVDYFEGKKHFCNAIINEKGFPELVVLATTDTKEPNGLEISFEVSDYYDFSSFSREAKEVLRPFPPASFSIQGYPNFEKDILRPSYLVEGKGWVLTGDASNLIMGNVEYPVRDRVEGLSPNARSVLEFGIHVEFTLGSFEVTPSREMVQWSDFSTDNVNSRLEDIYEEIIGALESSLVKCDNRWDAMLCIMKLRNTYRAFQINSLQWHGRDLLNDIAVRDSKLGIRTVAREYVGRKGYLAVTRTPIAVVPGRTTKIYLGDVADAHRRVSYAISSGGVEGTCLFISAETNRKYKKALKTLGIRSRHLTMASTLPPSPVAEKKTKKKYKAISKSKVFSLVSTHSRRSRDDWKEISIDFDAPGGQGLYTEIRRWKIAQSPEYNSFMVLKALKGLNLIPENTSLVGVRTSSIPKFQASPKWKTLDEFVPALVKKLLLSDKELFLSYDFWLGQVSLAFENQKARDFLSTYDRVKSKLDPSSYLHKVGKLLIRFRAQRKRVNFLRDLLQVCPSFQVATRHFPPGDGSSYSYRTTDETKIDDCLYMKRVFKTYPLLDTIILNTSVSPESIVEYIQAMDYYHSRNK